MRVEYYKKRMFGRTFFYFAQSEFDSAWQELTSKKTVDITILIKIRDRGHAVIEVKGR